MILSFKKSIFFLIFFVFQLLLVFSFSTSFSLVVTCAYILFLVSFFYLFKLRVVFSKKLFLIFFLFLVALFISSFFSHNLPLTIESIVYYFSSFLVLIFFHSAFSLGKIAKRQIFLLLLFVVFLLSSFFLLSLFFKNLFLFLPTLNLITLNYGHSHIAVLLLGIIPVSWWFYYSTSMSIKLPKQILIVFLYILLFFSFGRLTIILSLLSLPLLMKKPFLKKRLVRLTVLFFSFLVLLSLLVISLPGIDCINQQLKQQICKPINKDARLKYFITSSRAIFDNPIFGYGPGTYSLINVRYSLNNKLSSIFAHNFLLQLTAESGLVAGFLFVVLLYFFLKRAIYLLRNSSKDKLEYFLALSFILFFINSIFDFDWNIFYVLQFSLIFLAGFLGFSDKKSLLRQVTTVIWYFVALVVISIGFLSLLSRIILVDEENNLAVDVYPYSYEDYKKIINSQLDEKHLNRMFEIYKYDADVLYRILALTNNSERKIEIYNQLTLISPWTVTNLDYLELLYSQSDYKKMGEIAYQGLILIDDANKYDYQVRYEKKQNLAFYLLESANYHLNNHEVDVAARYYKKVLEVEKWAVHIYTPFFRNSKLSLSEMASFIRLSEINQFMLGKNHREFYLWVKNKLSTEDDQLNSEGSEFLVNFFVSE